MTYNTGDILRTDTTGTHVMIMSCCLDIEGIGYYKVAPLHDLSKVYMFNTVWLEDKTVLVQRGNRE